MRKAGTHAQIRRLWRTHKTMVQSLPRGMQGRGGGGGAGTHLAVNMFFKLFECFQRAHITFIKITLNS